MDLRPQTVPGPTRPISEPAREPSSAPATPCDAAAASISFDDVTGTDTNSEATPSDPEATALPPIFTDEDGIEKLWVQAYQGEVLGEALFDRLAVVLDDRAEPEHAGAMRVLATLERRTKEAVAPALSRAGIPTAPDQEQLDLADALAEGSAHTAWDDLMSATVAITGQFLPLYRRIGELNPSEHDVAELLVAHEEALRDFARAELAGRTSSSLDPVRALPHMV